MTSGPCTAATLSSECQGEPKEDSSCAQRDTYERPPSSEMNDFGVSRVCMSMDSVRTNRQIVTTNLEARLRPGRSVLRRRGPLLVAGAVAGLVLAACGGSAS